MTGLILCLNMVFSPFTNSAATSIRSGGILLNPAGLAIQPGFEFYFNGRETNDREIYYYSISMGNLGFSFTDYLKTEIYSLGLGVPFGESFSLGYSYSFGDIKEQRIGFLISPFKVLRFGGILYMPEKYDSSFTAGIAIRPFTDRITLSADFNFWDIMNTHSYQGVLEIFDGFYLYGGARIDERINETRYFAGIEISTGQLKGFISSNIKDEKVEYSGGVVLSGEIYPTVFPKKKKWVKIELKGNYPEERKMEGFLSFRPKKSFYDFINGLKRIQKEKDITGIILVFKNPAFSPAQAEEVYNILKDLKINGKKIVSIGESFDIRDYMIASISDRIIIVPTGDIDISGLYMENIYLKNMLAKVGIEPEIERIGKYKSAVEPFLRENMSEEDRFQRMEFLKDVHNLIVKNIAEGKGVSEDKVNEWINKGYFNSESAVEAGLADTQAFESDLENLCKKWFDKKQRIYSYEKLSKRRYLRREFKDERPKIAILIGEGGIVTGESGENPIPIIGGKNMGSETMSKLIEKIEKDKSIKAVVFRINSPGGSALASEIIWDGIRKLKEKKPVVVSMGQVAGSGGYYIACPGSKILADRATLTGSIGILGIKFVMKDFFNKLGITFDRVKTTPHADAWSFTRKLTDEEREIFRKEIEWGYWQFIKRVSFSRNLPKEKVDSLGQGRIYSGEDAKNVKLIDQTGGLLDAIKEAKKLAGIKGDVRIVMYPTPKWWKMINPFEKVNLNTPLFSNEKYLYMMPFFTKFY